MVPCKDGKANRGHSCVKGRFAWGYATHQERILKPMVRDKITDPVARDDLGGGDRPRRLRVQAHPGPVRPRRRRRHHLVALHQRGDLPRPEADPRRLRRQQRRHLRPRLPLADRLRPEDRVRHLAPARRTSTRSSTADVMMVIGANPTDGHPVFASRMKKRLREGAKLIVVDPRRIDIVRTPHVEAALSPAAAARHQRRRADRDGARHRHRGARQRDASCASAASWTTSSEWAAFVAEERHSPEAIAQVHRRRSRPSCAPRPASTPPAATRRSTTASASPSTARARPRSWRSPTSPWRPATSAGPASA